jgi:hypothetical protein
MSSNARRPRAASRNAEAALGAQVEPGLGFRIDSTNSDMAVVRRGRNSQTCTKRGAAAGAGFLESLYIVPLGRPAVVMRCVAEQVQAVIGAANGG